MLTGSQHIPEKRTVLRPTIVTDTVYIYIYVYIGQNSNIPCPGIRNKSALTHCDAERLDVVKEKVCERERSTERVEELAYLIDYCRARQDMLHCGIITVQTTTVFSTEKWLEHAGDISHIESAYCAAGAVFIFCNCIAAGLMGKLPRLLAGRWD